jgi:predicted RNA-binding Zn ribbon-like protein
MHAQQPSLPGLSNAGHAHAADLDTSLGFVNTLELTATQPIEHLGSRALAVEHLATGILAHRDALEREAETDDDAWLARVHGIRAALREVWDAQVEGRPASEHALDELNRVLERRIVPLLEPEGPGVRVGHRHGPDATGEALAALVEPVVAAIAANDTGRFRVCANDACRWVFEDTSRTGRRRWCDMRICGNRAKVARHRARRRSGTRA